MKKVRLFKHDDNSVAITCFSWNRKLDSETDKQFMDRMSIDHINFPDHLKKLSFVDILDTDLPKTDNKNGSYMEQIYIEDKAVKFDENWDCCVKPIFLIKKDYVEAIKDKINVELLRASPDTLKLIKLQKDLGDYKDFTDKDWYQKALDMLNESGADKPLIQQKLLEKIQ